jgi:hypothetical protein
MKNYIALASVLGTMILSGCAGAVPQHVQSVAPSLTAAEVPTGELAPSPYADTFSAEDEALMPSVRHPEPLPMDEVSTATPVTRTWGATAAEDYGF